jgi:hypothetical protein
MLSFVEHRKPDRSKEQEMATIHVDDAMVEWTSAVPFYGPNAVYNGEEIIQLKVLCDRRHEGGGISWIARFQPPQGKLIKIVAVALSDEHYFGLTGGRATKSGQPAKSSGGYGLNPKGQPHSAMIATESESLIIYTGEPDEIISLEVIDIAA